MNLAIARLIEKTTILLRKIKDSRDVFPYNRTQSIFVINKRVDGMKKIMMTLAATVLMAAPSLAADIAAGKAKSAVCAACHGQAGVSAVPMYPNLAGQKEEYLKKQLKDFKSGARKDPVMAPMAMPLSDEDIANLSAYYASLK
ncbi:Cytochrome c553 [Thalassotalea agarivorans]|uniref:Cytochrome c553 n=2 Tax=Thalassotalea agarivorans TaxID=349064 RepID=A0A1I0CJB2_THASX|nr:Cytochrome c553 [Thalassotalea agarivorans]